MESGLVDYYTLLQVSPGANQSEIKAAYRQLQKLCHPDILGPEHGDGMSMILNEATRELYDIDLEESKMEQRIGFTNKALSEWLPTTRPSAATNWNATESRALFVDEIQCIGCKNCLWQAPQTFTLDDFDGRARVVRQWADTEEHLQIAVESCPADCIYWVEKHELPVLEHVMKNMGGRVNIGIMKSCPHSSPDVFAAAATFRAKKAEGRCARKSWTEAYMYTKAQEAAMSRARNSHFSGVSGAPGFAAVRRIMAWVRGSLWASIRSWHIRGVGQAPHGEALLTHLRDQNAKQESHVGQLPGQPQNGEGDPGHAEGGVEAGTCGITEDTDTVMEEQL